MTRLLSRDRAFILVFLLPIALVVAALIYAPALDTLQSSLTNENLRVRRPPEFVGLENYVRLLEDPEFWEVTLRSLFVVIVVLPLELVLALAAALLLNEHFPGRGIVRALVLIPWLVPPSSTASSGAGSSTVSTGPSMGCSTSSGSSTSTSSGCANPPARSSGSRWSRRGPASPSP
jgi:ABC-type sugar transport system permease subunit